MIEVFVKKRYGELKEPFTVPTTYPYFIEGFGLSPEKKGELYNCCATLWKVLDRLGISAAEARVKQYTLNMHTWDELYHLALQKEDYETTKLLREGPWKR